MNQWGSFSGLWQFGARKSLSEKPFLGSQARSVSGSRHGKISQLSGSSSMSSVISKHSSPNVAETLALEQKNIWWDPFSVYCTIDDNPGHLKGTGKRNKAFCCCFFVTWRSIKVLTCNDFKCLDLYLWLLPNWLHKIVKCWIIQFGSCFKFIKQQ